MIGWWVFVSLLASISEYPFSGRGWRWTVQNIQVGDILSMKKLKRGLESGSQIIAAKVNRPYCPVSPRINRHGPT